MSRPMTTWGRCPSCDQLVRVRKDNTLMWTHLMERAQSFFHWQFPRCPGSGKLPSYLVDRARRPGSKLAAFPSREERKLEHDF